jgi:5-methylcytosine-specific restriction endonuclease McrA
MDILLDKVLVLNRSFFPLQLITVRKALIHLFTDTAVVMDEYWASLTFDQWSASRFYMTDRVIRTSSRVYIAPEILRLKEHDEVYNREICLTRQNIFLRDDFECQYCGDKAETIDHVIPKSRPAEFHMTSRQINSWTNLVACCKPCNTKKDNRTPDEAEMALKNMPRKPSTIKFKMRRGWKKSWSTYCY